MKELSKKILSMLTAAAMIFTIFASPVGEIFGFVGETVKASAANTIYMSNYNSKKITSASDSRVTAALALIDAQASASSSIRNSSYASDSVKEMIKHFMLESKYAAIGGSAFTGVTNAQYSDGVRKYNFTDGVYYSEFTGCGGCLFYAKWVRNSIYKYDSSTMKATTFANSEVTVDNIKKTLMEEGQAGETIHINSNHHHIVFVACDETGFYYLDWAGSTGGVPAFRYIAYEDFVKYAKAENCKNVSLENRNMSKNTCTHTFGSWTTKTSATCTADGLKQRTCSKCGKVESATITKLGHSYTSSVTKAATCTATGVRTYKCSRCTSSYTESIAKTGHSYTTGYEAAHPHKNYKKCTTCGTYEYTGTTQYLYNCASCTNLTAPTITSITSPANINKEVTIKWTASTSDKLDHYWVRILDPNGDVAVSKNVDKTVTSYTFTPTMHGEYTINIAATPTGSSDGTGSLWGNATITVHDIARYYEATHPHKYVDYCKNCDYMVYVGTNLGYYEKCKTCHDSVAPSKPVVKNVASSYVVGDSIIVKWDATTNTTHYNITLWKKDETGEYKSIEWVPYAENGHTFTGYGVGEYGISIQSYNSGYFYQYSETYRDWVHTSSSSVRFTIKPEGIKNFSVTSKTANTITLNWTKNTTATGYIIQQMKNGTWTNIANISNNATTTYTVSGLAASTSYSFRAVAYTTVNGSNIYGSYTASTPAITLPASITGFAITGRDSSSLTLSWAKNTSADGYVIQQQVNGAWSNIAVLKSNATVTYKVTELDPNAFYRFRMVAFKSHDGTKLYSKYTGAMSAYTAPAMVSGLKVVTDSETQLTVSWSKVDSANGYVLDIYKDGKWTEVARYKSNATLKYVATGLTAGTQYKFRIKSFAVNNSLTIYSTYSSPVIAVTKPAQVTGFKITANGSNSVSLSWNKMNASGYVIQCLKNNEWVTVGNIKDGTVTSYTVTGLTANSSYKFRMVAYATVNNTSVYGKYTAALAGRTAPAKVTNLTMTNRGTDFISVRWDKNEKADGYMIYLYDGTKWTCVKTMTSNSAVSHKITGLESGKAYKITVKAYKTVDNVKYVSDSVTISATTL